MTEKTTEKTAKAEAEKPVLYYTGPGSLLVVPARDLYEADLFRENGQQKRSKEALIRTGFYSETKPKGAAK
jgi:hypothetical protein